MKRSAPVAVLLLLAAGCVGTASSRSAGIVAAATPEAVAAGLRVLEAGGNAADAAVAVSLALGVTEPAGSGIAGQVFVLVHVPGEVPQVVHGSTRAPSSVPAGVRDEDLRGRRECAVPSALAVLDVMHRRFGGGRVEWPELCRPGIEAAENGYVQGRFRTASAARYRHVLAGDALAARTFLDTAGRTPPAGTRIRRPELAATLKRIARDGAADFYRGGIAREIAADMADNDGWITAADLAGFPEPQVVDALRTTWRGYDVYSLPPPAGGWVVLLALELLEQMHPHGAPPEPEATVALARALDLAHGERRRSPLGGGAGAAAVAAERAGEAYARDLLRESRGETTHFCVADRDGMVVSVTQSINNYFGCGVLHPTLGFFYNDYMREFETGMPDHPFALRPDALPFSSMSATMLVREGRVELALGSPGSGRIISAVVQVIRNFAALGMDVERAVAAPRVHVLPEDGRVRLERVPSPELVLHLERAGYSVDVPLNATMSEAGNPYFGGVHAIARDGDGWRGAADMRRDGEGRAAGAQSPVRIRP